MATTDKFCDYMGQYCGWHFYVVETAAHRELMIDAAIASSIIYGIAIPPVDGKPYATTENRQPPDPLADGGVPPGTIQFVGSSKAEAVAKAVEAMRERLGVTVEVP